MTPKSRRVLNLLNKPHYVFRPSQLVRRLCRPRSPAGNMANSAEPFADAELPWGLPIRFRRGEVVGDSIERLGLWDLCVSETLWRLLDSGETALDVGANIGHMTGLMAVRTGTTGRVHAFEPHPDVFAELSGNVDRWRSRSGVAAIVTHEIALSENGGAGHLRTNRDFAHNRGLAALGGARRPANENEAVHTVSLRALDDLFPANKEPVGVVKIDVEGHELGVLRGAARLLEAGRVRDIVFEEHERYPTNVTRYLEACGYALFCLRQGFWGVGARDLADAPATVTASGNSWDAPSFLATRDPARARARLGPPGWQVLRARAAAASSARRGEAQGTA